MKKHVFGKQFKRDINERKALFKGLMTSLILHERIETTEAKAKAIKPSVEKLVTKVKKGSANMNALLLPFLTEPAAKKLVGDIAPRFSSRPGGYTRIIRLGKRFNDDASMVLLEWVERSTAVVKSKAPKVKDIKEAEELQKTTETPVTTEKIATPKKTPEKKTTTKKPVAKKVSKAKKEASK